jgi:acetyl esterase/lipase
MVGIPDYAIVLGMAWALAFGDSNVAGAESEFKKTTIAYREVDGHKVLADVYRHDDEQVRPVLVWIHGGALIMGHREGITRA